MLDGNVVVNGASYGGIKLFGYVTPTSPPITLAPSVRAAQCAENGLHGGRLIHRAGIAAIRKKKANRKRLAFFVGGGATPNVFGNSPYAF
jgi:hypothetical protein